MYREDIRVHAIEEESVEDLEDDVHGGIWQYVESKRLLLLRCLPIVVVLDLFSLIF